MPHIKFEILLAILAVPIVGGIISTRFWVKRREQGTIAMRLSQWAKPTVTNVPFTLLKKQQSDSDTPIKQYLLTIPALDALKTLLLEANLEDHLLFFLLLIASLLFLPLLIAFFLGFNVFIAALVGLVLAGLPFIALKTIAGAERTKFCEQLPDAIDLMVAVLRSGHSISQSVKAVADEIPNPCGKEFAAVLHRMNLGQPLPQSLILSTKRFNSYELDLIRRAVAIQAEVGGSLAELLDKTNSTLRERLKLARQLRVITVQSRLSAQIIGLLPIILAIGLNFISPGYLQILVEDKLGQTMLVGVIMLEIIGIFVMQRLSTLKV